jgi:hypothetical protein
LETTSDRLVAPTPAVKVKLDPWPGALVPTNVWAEARVRANRARSRPKIAALLLVLGDS